MIRVDFKVEIGVFAWMCEYVTQTHMQWASFFYPWFVISVLFNRRHTYRTGQDIENCGTCRDCACIIYRYVLVCTREPLHIHCFFFLSFFCTACELHRDLVSVHSRVHHAVILNHISLGSSIFMAWLGLSFCSVWQHSRMQHFWVRPLRFERCYEIY